MSLFEIKSTHFKPYLAGLLVLLLGLVTSGCFRPLYGAIDPNNDLAGSSPIYVETISGQMGQTLQNELQFLLSPVRDIQNRSLSLKVTPSQSQKNFFTDVDRDRAKLGAVAVEARYELVEVGNKTPITKGTASASASFENDGQILNREQAIEDAADRAAKTVARIGRGEVVEETHGLGCRTRTPAGQ